MSDFIPPSSSSRINLAGLVTGLSDPFFDSERFSHVKDPCPVFDGFRWHLFGSGDCRATGSLRIFHATACGLAGPWKEERDAELVGLSGPEVAAPGVVYDNRSRQFHMFIQTRWKTPGGTIEHLVSSDGSRFERRGAVISAEEGTDHGIVYDPHPAEVDGRKFITYSAGRRVGRPDIYLAESVSGSWDGPFEKRGRILAHHDIPHHNQLDHDDYEWGLEGSQLVGIGGGIVLLNAVCFLPHASPGKRQRMFFAVAVRPEGPFRTLGPVINTSGSGWLSGENGHGTVLLLGQSAHIFFHSRSTGRGSRWVIGRAEIRHSDLICAAEEAVAGLR